MTEDLSPQILRRKSFRSFRQEPLEETLLEDLVDYLSSLTPPEADIDWNFDTLPYLDLMRVCSGEPGVKAPMYLILRAERKRFSLQNCGYLGELAVLWLSARNVATCWQGSVRIEQGSDFPGSLPFVTAIALGYSDESFRQDPSEFERKPYEKMVYNREEKYRPILELGRLAPSSFNRQPCVFVSDDRGRIHLYRKKSFLSNPVTDFAQCVDAGAALAHLELGARAAGYQTEIQRLRPEPRFKGNLIYQATLALNE
jgi:hypothetical protein